MGGLLLHRNVPHRKKNTEASGKRNTPNYTTRVFFRDKSLLLSMIASYRNNFPRRRPCNFKTCRERSFCLNISTIDLMQIYRRSSCRSTYKCWYKMKTPPEMDFHRDEVKFNWLNFLTCDNSNLMRECMHSIARILILIKYNFHDCVYFVSPQTIFPLYFVKLINKRDGWTSFMISDIHSLHR